MIHSRVALCLIAEGEIRGAEGINFAAASVSLLPTPFPMKGYRLLRFFLRLSYGASANQSRENSSRSDFTYSLRQDGHLLSLHLLFSNPPYQVLARSTDALINSALPSRDLTTSDVKSYSRNGDLYFSEDGPDNNIAPTPPNQGEGS